MRSDLIETFKIVNRKYSINPELFFQLDEGDKRGHDQKLFKKRIRLNVRKQARGKMRICGFLVCKMRMLLRIKISILPTHAKLSLFFLIITGTLVVWSWPFWFVARACLDQ